MSRAVPIDQALRDIDAAREARLERPSPYRVPEGNPFAPERCPVLACGELKSSQGGTLRKHLEKAHGCITHADVERVNRICAVAERLKDVLREAKASGQAGELEETG